jgi:hypothetical protein
LIWKHKHHVEDGTTAFEFDYLVVVSKRTSPYNNHNFLVSSAPNSSIL